MQSSIRRQFGLASDHRRVPPAEQGISELMVELYRESQAPLDEARLLHSHASVMNGRRDLVGGVYRECGDPMQVVSGPLHAPKVHFEAPPASAVPNEMRRFLEWYRNTGPEGTARLPMLTRAGMGFEGKLTSFKYAKIAKCSADTAVRDIKATAAWLRIPCFQLFSLLPLSHLPTSISCAPPRASA